MYNTKNFRFQEFACVCCGKNLINPQVMDICQAIRDELGVPVRVNSGYRCVLRNNAVHGSKSSYHLKGLAADISCKLGSQAIVDAIKKLIREEKIKISWCCHYITRDFVHIDIGAKRINQFATVIEKKIF